MLQGVRGRVGAVFSVTKADSLGVYRHLAGATGGAFYDLERSQDFTTLLDTIGRQIEGMFEEM